MLSEPEREKKKAQPGRGRMEWKGGRELSLPSPDWADPCLSKSRGFPLPELVFVRARAGAFVDTRSGRSVHPCFPEELWLRIVIGSAAMSHVSCAAPQVRPPLACRDRRKDYLETRGEIGTEKKAVRHWTPLTGGHSMGNV